MEKEPLNKEVLNLLDKTNLKVNKFISVLEKDELPSMSLIEDQLLQMQSQLVVEGKLTDEMFKTLENYSKLGVINKETFNSKNIEDLENGIIDAITKLEEKRKNREVLKEEVEKIDYINNKQKKQIEELLDSVLSDAEVNIVDALTKNLNAENKAIVKTLSSLENDIKNSNKVSMFERKELVNQLDSIVKTFKETGGLSEQTLSDLLDIMKTLKEKGIELSEEDTISKIIEQSISKNVLTKQFDEALDTIEKYIDEETKSSPLYQQLISGQITIEDFIKEFNKQGKDTTKLLDEISKKFDTLTILTKEMDSYLAETTELTADQREVLKKAFTDFKNGLLTKDQLKSIFEKYGVSKDQFSELETYMGKVEEAVKSNQLDNADKIMQEKRFELLEKTATTLAEVSEEIKAQNSKKFFGEVVKNSNSLEEFGENATVAILDKIFGGGTILDKVFDKFSKKYGGKLASKLGGLFEGLFNKIKLPKMGGALSTVARTGASLLRTGAGLAARALPALVSNPVGWAVLGATAVVGAGFAWYNHKYGKDKEIIEQLEKMGIVDYSVLGNSEIKDWGKLLKMADDKTLQSLIHFDDWDDTTMKMLKILYKMKPEDRMILAEQFDKGNAYIINGKLHLSKEAVADLVTQIKNKKELKQLFSILDDSSKQIAKENKTMSQVIKEQNKPKKKISTLQRAKHTAKELLNSSITPIGAGTKVVKFMQSMFGGDKYELVERLEDMGALEHYVIGNSEIKDWDMIEKLSSQDIKKLIEFDDWDDETKKRLIALYQEKLKQQKSGASVPTISENTKNKIKALKEKGYTDAHIAKYLGVPEEKVAKITSVSNQNLTDKVVNLQKVQDKTKEQQTKEQNVTVVTQNVVKNPIVRETDLSNYQLATQLGGI